MKKIIEKIKEVLRDWWNVYKESAYINQDFNNDTRYR